MANEKIVYQQVSGVVLNKQLLSKSQFQDVFKELLKNINRDEGNVNKTLQFIADNLKSSQYTKTDKNGRTRTITRFEGELEEISRLFTKDILPGLGGDISLLTTMDFLSKEQATFFLAHETELPTFIDQEKNVTLYNNSKQGLQELKKQGKKIKRLNDALASHLRTFYSQLTSSKTLENKDRIALESWAQTHMPNRYEAMEKHKNYTLARYFWGRGKIIGYTAEAFGSHLALMHPNFLNQQHSEKLQSVISEHGGAGSSDLFTLLWSAKGNVMSQLSGDIVVVNDKGQLIFNIQSKATRSNSYPFTITYQKFMSNIKLFIDALDHYKSLSQDQLDKDANFNKDIDLLYERFSTKAWQQIKGSLEDNISTTVKDMVIHRDLTK